jgi:XTP/dITP diphosphohydrolase
VRIIVATKNQDKVKEISKILKRCPYNVVSLSALRKKIYIREDGKTFEENAVKKALAVSKGYPKDYVLGEDSGLSVEYLNGLPGVHSKRYSGKNANTFKNNKKLLKALEGVPLSKRDAAYKCLLVLAKNKKVLKVFEGECRGRINNDFCGENGFGYDPVFYLPEFKKTAAEISVTAKNKISHRGKAFRKFNSYISKIAGIKC